MGIPGFARSALSNQRSAKRITYQSVKLSVPPLAELMIPPVAGLHPKIGVSGWALARQDKWVYPVSLNMAPGLSTPQCRSGSGVKEPHESSHHGVHKDLSRMVLPDAVPTPRWLDPA
jgi:hypothetical protein